MNCHQLLDADREQCSLLALVAVDVDLANVRKTSGVSNGMQNKVAIRLPNVDLGRMLHVASDLQVDAA